MCLVLVQLLHVLVVVLLLQLPDQHGLLVRVPRVLLLSVHLELRERLLVQRVLKQWRRFRGGARGGVEVLVVGPTGSLGGPKEPNIRIYPMSNVQCPLYIL